MILSIKNKKYDGWYTEVGYYTKNGTLSEVKGMNIHIYNESVNYEQYTLLNIVNPHIIKNI